MKRVLVFLLALSMVFALCACGGGGKKLTVQEVEAAYEKSDGKLQTETSGDNVTSFTYVLEDINAKKLVDKDYVRDAVDAVMSGDASRITYNHIRVSRAVLAMMNTLVLLGEGADEDFDSSAFIESILEILCDNKTPEYSGWTVSTKIDQSADTLTITVRSK
jgi:hypothetical protein